MKIWQSCKLPIYLFFSETDTDNDDTNFMSLKTQSTFNLHVNISFKEVIECVERLRLEALGQLTVEALLVGFPQERINVLVGAQADVVE